MISEENKQHIQLVAQEILSAMGYAAAVKWMEASIAGFSTPVLSIESTENLSLLIGNEGKNLEALEHVIHVVARKVVAPDSERDMAHFIVDINRYRVVQAAHLVAVAKESAERVMASGRPESLIPMPSYQRRIIHAELAAYRSIETGSIGEEPNRRVVIKPASRPPSGPVHEGLKGSF